MLTAMCIAAANRIIEKTNEFNNQHDFQDKIFMTCKRLQKILYFCDVEYMQRNFGKSMFKDEFQAWPSGPVIPSVYHQFMQYQTGDMEPIPSEEKENLSKEMMDVIDYVLDKTNGMDTIDLIKLSHVPKGPWSLAYNEKAREHNQTVSKTEMYRFYRSNNLF